MRLAGHIACMGERRDAYTVLVRKPEGKRPLGRHTCRWEDNIKMDLLYMAQSVKVRLNRGDGHLRMR